MSSKAPILALETAMGHCSVAIWRDGDVVAARAITERNQQTRMLVPLIAEAMKEVQLSFEDLHAIATTVGPGSFTGIRIGLATARGLAMASNKPLHTITNLELLAWQALEEQPDYNGPVVSAINAYRNQVYLHLFNVNDGALIEASAAQAISVDDISNHLPNGSFLLAGDAERVMANALENTGYTLAENTAIPSAGTLARAIAALPDSTFEGRKVAPVYLRAPDAKPQAPLLKVN